MLVNTRMASALDMAHITTRMEDLLLVSIKPIVITYVPSTMYHDNFHNIQQPFSFCSQYDGWSFESENYWTSPSLSSFLKYHHIINHNHRSGQYSSDQRDGSGVMYYPGGRFIIIVIRTYIFHNGWNYFFISSRREGRWEADKLRGQVLVHTSYLKQRKHLKMWIPGKVLVHTSYWKQLKHLKMGIPEKMEK